MRLSAVVWRMGLDKEKPGEGEILWGLMGIQIWVMSSLVGVSSDKKGWFKRRYERTVRWRRLR